MALVVRFRGGGAGEGGGGRPAVRVRIGELVYNRCEMSQQGAGRRRIFGTSSGWGTGDSRRGGSKRSDGWPSRATRPCPPSCGDGDEQ